MPWLVSLGALPRHSMALCRTPSAREYSMYWMRRCDTLRWSSLQSGETAEPNGDLEPPMTRVLKSAGFAAARLPQSIALSGI